MSGRGRFDVPTLRVGLTAAAAVAFLGLISLLTAPAGEVPGSAVQGGDGPSAIEPGGTPTVSESSTTARPAPDGGSDSTNGALADPSEVAESPSVGSETPGQGSEPSKSAPVDQDGSASGQVPVGQGFDDQVVRIGIGWLDTQGVGATCQAFGTGDCSAAEELNVKEWAERVVQWVNENGGLAGYRVEPIYYSYDIGSLLTAEARRRTEQEMCALWTEDNEVFAMLPTRSHEGILVACARDSNTVFMGLTAAEIVWDRAKYQEMAELYYRPNWFLPERREEVIATRLVETDFFPADARVGLMIDGRPGSRAAAPALEATLAELGVNVVTTIVYPDMIESPWATYVLQLQSENVTHVVFGSHNSQGPPLFMTRQAESQGYRPKWAIGSDLEPALMAGSLEPRQAVNMTLVGWSVRDDMGLDYTPNPLNDADRLCQEINEDGTYHAGYCEGFFLLKRALDGASQLTPAGMAAAVGALDRSFESPSTYTTTFGPGRHHGASSVRNYAYNRDCSCFRPTSNPVYVG